MGMKVTVKVKFNASIEKFEKFGSGMYLCYLPYPEDNEIPKILASLISKNMGVSPNRIEFAGKDVRNNFIFETM